MINDFKGPYTFNEDVVRNWDSDTPGVYYLGIKTPENQLLVYYIGKAVSGGGIRSRLLEHIGENKWHDITNFGYYASTPLNIAEVEKLETEEIAKYSPKYNVNGVSVAV